MSSKAYGDILLYEDLNFNLPPGGIIGVIGPNGAGKTTLFRMITGKEKPDAGTFTIGETVKLAYVDQNRPLDPEKTIWQEISGGEEIISLGHREVNSRAYVARFNFSGTDQQKKTSACSRAASGTACTWPRCCAKRRTCSCLTSRRTTWT